MTIKPLLEFEDVLNTYNSKYHGKIALKAYKSWFPLYPSESLAGIVADLIGDGHLQKEPKLRIDYTSNSKSELRRFENDLYALFGVKGKIRPCKTNSYESYNLGINCKPLGRVLSLIGVPSGNKVESSFTIPNWIKSDKIRFTRFVNRLFCCEGCVDTYSRCLELKMHKLDILLDDGLKLFNDIRLYLNEYYSIHTTRPFLVGSASLRKDGSITRGIRIKIRRKDSIRRFAKYIGLDNKTKNNKLRSIL